MAGLSEWHFVKIIVLVKPFLSNQGANVAKMLALKRYETGKLLK
jgi:hypothetical protein